MAEVLDQEAPQTETPAAQQAPAASGFSEAAPAPRKKKKNRKRIIRRIITLLILAALLVGGYFLWKRLGADKDEGTGEVLTEMVSRGSITSVVEGSGAAVAKNSASVTLLSGGQVLDVYVKEGDYVHKGDPLYTIESSDAEARVNDALKSISNYEKELSKLREEANDLNVRAEYTGKLLNVSDIKVGDAISKNQEIATLVDDTKMLLSLYFSYIYENDIFVGQEATVSVPITMAQLPGTVHEIHKVRRVSPEGSNLFEVVFVLDNPGSLTADMEATATVLAEGETVYPYEAGKLKYFRENKLKAKVNGDVSWVSLYNYGPVSAGQSVLTLTADSSETEIASLENQLRSARRTLEDAQKNLDSLNAFAPIDGTVLSIGITQGEEAKTGTVAVNIADTTTMIVNTNVDEMYVSFVKAGMPVDLKLGERDMIGLIDSVSLSAKSENGVARFPMVISVDNSEELLMSGAYVNYSFTASQSEDCLLVPIQCVKSAQTAAGDNCKVLFVQSDVPLESSVELDLAMMTIPEGFQPVYVEVGISDNRNTEILSDIEEGTVVYAGVVDNGGGGFGMYF